MTISYMLSSSRIYHDNNEVAQICIFRFCQWKNLELNIQLSMNDFSVHRSQTSTLSFCLQQSFKSSIFKFWNFQKSLVYIVISSPTYLCHLPYPKKITQMFIPESLVEEGSAVVFTIIVIFTNLIHHLCYQRTSLMFFFFTESLVEEGSARCTAVGRPTPGRCTP